LFGVADGCLYRCSLGLACGRGTTRRARPCALRRTLPRGRTTLCRTPRLAVPQPSLYEEPMASWAAARQPTFLAATTALNVQRVSGDHSLSGEYMCSYVVWYDWCVSYGRSTCRG
jgi:hypothetical protein